MRTLLLTLTSVILMACGAEQAPQAHHAWIADAPPGAKVRAAFLRIDNPGPKGLKLHGVSSEDFERIELHTVDMSGGMMRMRKVDHLNIEAGNSLELAPGGAHLMLKQARRDLRLGDSTTLTLQFTDNNGQARTLDIAAAVKAQHKDAAQHEH